MRIRKVIKIQHFTGFPEYFMGGDPLLQPQKVVNTMEKGRGLAGTSHTPPKMWITPAGCISP